MNSTVDKRTHTGKYRMLECNTKINTADFMNVKINNLKPCAECGSVTNLYQYNLCKVCLSKSFKKLVKIIDSVRK
ncbi:hypothetical protein EHQ23_15325 [Leptospira bourretii]|uniref:Uncharacterized protein n=6 Tax=Leptospira TaxID=171 RepID=A0A2N0AKC8_9LEPT|nr:hypothetical protein CH359_08810 [Leptospira meyeri]PJZ84756.1 hypothetical protein CH364_00270 [Leptospira harrisiae]TGK85983.1 hypothetical protein EHQ23_15325 [Leptospira bourretii]TGM52364.1 hypothetical protein EHQ95_11920 [Leptospira vanthielii]TGN15292.1 hypothetical protein EHR08_03045 [Leptospira bandrabouensis]